MIICTNPSNARTGDFIMMYYKKNFFLSYPMKIPEAKTLLLEITP